MVSASGLCWEAGVPHLCLRRNSASSSLTSTPTGKPCRSTVQACSPRATELAISLKCTLKCEALTVVSVMPSPYPRGLTSRPGRKKIIFFGPRPPSGTERARVRTRRALGLMGGNRRRRRRRRQLRRGGRHLHPPQDEG